MIFNHARLVVGGYLLPHLQGKFLFLIAKISVIGCVYKCARRFFSLPTFVSGAPNFKLAAHIIDQTCSVRGPGAVLSA